jgi:hypothetical protein
MKCDLCGEEAIAGQTTPYNAIHRWYWIRPQFKIIWFCMEHFKMFPMMKRKIDISVKERTK